jgi:predicted dehydrogenase
MAVKYGVIGCGAIAQRRHIPEAVANSQSSVVALVDPNRQRVKTLAEQYDATAYTDYRKMLEDDQIDAVVVATPNALHAQQTVDALKAGKHVLCEKPMATTREDARRMIREAGKRRKYLMIGLNQRLVPAHIRARQILRTGRLGNVLGFRTAFKHPGPDKWSVDGAASWFFNRRQAVMGATGDLGVHKADLMRWLLDEEITEVGGIITTRDKRDLKGRLLTLDDNAYLTLKTSSDAVGSMIVSWTNYGGEENYTILYCQNGVMRIDDDPTYGVIVDYSNGDQEMHKVGDASTNVKQVASGVIDSFTDCIIKRHKPEIDGTEGYRCLNIILTAMEAAKQKKGLRIRN